MSRQEIRIPACTIPPQHGSWLATARAEGFVPSQRATVRRARQRGHGQVVPLSGRWSRCVRATAEVYSESEGNRPGSYELSEPGLGRYFSAGGGEAQEQVPRPRPAESWIEQALEAGLGKRTLLTSKGGLGFADRQLDSGSSIQARATGSVGWPL
eukprot:254918-Pleurochrysis_carterae.AAC.2